MHPELFELFNYPVHTYAVMIALGFIVGIWLAARYGEQVGYDRDLILDLCWWILVSGLVGSRVVFMIVNWEQYYYPCFDFEYFNELYPTKAIEEADCTRLLYVWNGGLVFYGGVIGAMLTLVWFMRREGLKILPMADVLIPSLAVGQFFGRLGCLGAGCCWGEVTQSSWGLVFPKFADSGKWTMVYSDQAKDPELLGRLSEVSGDFALPVHPTQLYDSLCGLFLFCVLIYVRHRKRFHGQVFVWWLLLYPVLRSTVEIFRGDHRERGMVYAFDTTGLNEALGLPIESHAFLSTSQFISLGMMSVALVILWRQRKSEGVDGPPAAGDESPQPAR